MEPLRTLWSLTLVLLVSCGGRAPTGSQGPPPTRIIALAPSAVEILFALGLGDRVVGVGDHVSWPPEAENRTKVGGLFDVRLEVVTSLRPDLAVLLPSEETLQDQLERLGVETLEIRSDSLEDFSDAVRAIAGRCDARQRGEELLAGWWSELDRRTRDSSPSVVLTLGRDPGRLASILVAGPGTYLDELIALAGATNAFGDAGANYPEVGLEEMIRRDPDVIVELRTSPADPARLLADWRTVPHIGAVDAGCIEMIAGEHVLIPGPRLPLLYHDLTEILDRCETP